MNLFRTYFLEVYEGIRSSIEGLALTLKHIFHSVKHTNPVGISNKDYFSQTTGIVTLEYPFQSFPVPDNGRYRLHNEIDDCIVCDKCAKICPVNCIDITSIKSAEEIGVTSDGSSKRLYAATFDIDMAKCCYCGLCTTVCPTECLTMTSTYDFSEFDVTNMVYHFTDLTPEAAREKQRLYELKQAEKAAALTAKAPSSDSAIKQSPESNFRPVVKPRLPASEPEKESGPGTPTVNKPSFKPKMPVKKDTASQAETQETPPVLSSDHVASQDQNIAPASEPPLSKPVFKPRIPGIKPAAISAEKKEDSVPVPDTEVTKLTQPDPDNVKPVTGRPVFKPKIPGVKAPGQTDETLADSVKEDKNREDVPVTSKPAFKPRINRVIPPGKEDETN